MKKLTIILLLLALISCNTKATENRIPITDTVYITTIDSSAVKTLQDSLNIIRYEDYIARRKIEKIKHYVSLCEKNPNNKKFLLGWIKRTLDE